MTLPYEEVHSLRATRQFMYDLLDPSKTPRVPREIRRRAHRVCKHFPMDYSIEQRFSDVLGTAGGAEPCVESLRAENARLRQALLRIEREVVDATQCATTETGPQVNTEWVLATADEALRVREETEIRNELYRGEG